MGFSFAQNLPQQIGAAQNALAAGVGAVNAGINLASQLSTAFNATDVGSAIRAVNLPAAGEAIGDIVSAVGAFGGDANANDWRVRLSLPNWSSFKKSPVLNPLVNAGGLIFPYTPQITIASSAKYNPLPTTHTNFVFQAYQNSDPGTITITAPMNVEDPTQGLYWIAAVHYLRSLTKMFSGNDAKAGNPPPVVMLNGYGNYVFKNVPVVCTNFQTTLDATCDYIGVNVVGSAAGQVAGVADSIGGLSSTVGDLFGNGGDTGISGITNTITSIAGGVGQVAGLLGSFGIGGTTSGGVSHVPTKSTFTITLQPIYSRTSTKNFSLDRFVTGGYLNNSFGYI
jgi:hypothetical protein